MKLVPLLLLEDSPIAGFEILAYLVIAIVVFVALDRAWNRIAKTEVADKLSCSLRRHNPQLRCENGESYYRCRHCEAEWGHIQTNRPEN